MKTLTLSSIEANSLSPAGAAGSPKGIIALDCQSSGKPNNFKSPAFTSWFIPPKCWREAPRPSSEKAVQTIYWRIPAEFSDHWKNCWALARLYCYLMRYLPWSSWASSVPSPLGLCDSQRRERYRSRSCRSSRPFSCSR